MLTPRFKLSQDDENLFLWMHVPYIKYDDAECEISENTLFFSGPPYYLRLHLPGDILVETGPSSYDVDSGDLTINLKKKNKGEMFEGLDMLTWLLTPKKLTPLNPNIEVVGKTDTLEEAEHVGGESSSSHQSDIPYSSQITGNSDEKDNCNNSSLCNGSHEAAEETDWYIDQSITEPTSLNLTEEAKYGCGFALRKFNFGEYSSNVAFIIDIKDPNSLSILERRHLREEQENNKFDCEHYLADLFDDDMIKELIEPSYQELMRSEGMLGTFTDKESEKLLQLPKREYLIEPELLSQVFFGLVDLMFAYAYNCRFTHGEESIEADWTICKLSSTLSWFDSFCNLKDVIVACARRSFCFPLYRSWTFFQRVLDDVTFIFKSGKSEILKCLLDIHSVLQKSEDRHVLNDLYITDYCVWIQTVLPMKIESLAMDLSELEISKADIEFDFNLKDFETDARNMMDKCNDGDDVDALAERMKNTVNVTHVSDDSDDDEDDDYHDDDEDDDDYIDDNDFGDEDEDDDDDDEKDEDNDEDEEDDDDEEDNVGSKSNDNNSDDPGEDKSPSSSRRENEDEKERVCS